MKRFLAVTLVLSMLFLSIFVLASCKIGEKEGETTKGTTSVTPSTTFAPITTPAETEEYIYTDVSEKVYIFNTSYLNIRKAPVDGEIKTALPYGTEITRVGYNEGWSKVKLADDDTVYYASTKYLSTTEPADTTAPVEVVFNDVPSATKYVSWNNQTSGTVYIRPQADWSAITEVITIGTAVVVTAVAYDNDTETEGWSKITYNSETYYIRNSCLSDTNPTTPAA